MVHTFLAVFLAALFANTNPLKEHTFRCDEGKRFAYTMWMGNARGEGVRLKRCKEVVKRFGDGYNFPHTISPETFLTVMTQCSGREVVPRKINNALCADFLVVKENIARLHLCDFWFELEAYREGKGDPATKQYMGYVTDTAYISYFGGITSSSQLWVNRPLSLPSFRSGEPTTLLEAIFKTYCINAVRTAAKKLYDDMPQCYHWRERSRGKVDLIIAPVWHEKLYPFLFLFKNKLSQDDCQSLRLFREKYGERVGTGVIVYTGTQFYEPCEGVVAIPWNGMCVKK